MSTQTGHIAEEEKSSLARWEELFRSTGKTGNTVSEFFPGLHVCPAAVDALELFPKCFWKARHSQHGKYALGSTFSGTLSETLAHLENAQVPGGHALGGTAFSSCGNATDPAWEAWNPDFFFLPAVELESQPGGTLVRRIFSGDESCNREVSLVFGSEDVFTSILGSAERARETPHPPQAIARCDKPDFRGWLARVHSVLGELDRDALQKVVLARVSTLDLLAPADPYCLLPHLAAANPHCYIFAITPGRNSGTFLGASPERLFHRAGQHIQTEAVAGTRSRSLDPTEDTRLERQLIESAKERHEHGVVVEYLADAMTELCGKSWECNSPTVLKLARLQHLITLFRGTLRGHHDDGSLLATLHPTPATCGFPTNAAREFLSGREPFHRGWFAGPFGSVSLAETEFCVAIRSFHLRGGEVDVYAGAGIVESSDPAREWAELESKISGVLSLFAAA